jgi:hypothetical protein
MSDAKKNKPLPENLPKVTLELEYRPGTVMQRQAWRRLWLKLLAEAEEKEKGSKL